MTQPYKSAVSIRILSHSDSQHAKRKHSIKCSVHFVDVVVVVLVYVCVHMRASTVYAAAIRFHKLLQNFMLNHSNPCA